MHALQFAAVQHVVQHLLQHSVQHEMQHLLPFLQATTLLMLHMTLFTSP